MVVQTFFSIRFFFTDTDESQDSRGRKGTIFYSTLPLPLAHKHSDIYLQICMWDDYHIFLIAPPGCYSMRFTTLSNYHLIDWWCDVDSCLFTCWFDSRILSTAIWHGKPILQANRLSKCASHPKLFHLEVEIFSKKERREVWMLFCLGGRKLLILEKELFLWETRGMQINHKRNFIQDSCQILSFHFKSTFHWPFQVYCITQKMHISQELAFLWITFQCHET